MDKNGWGGFSVLSTLFALAALTSFVGCTTTTTATYDQLQKSYEVARGTVLQIEVVTIDDAQNEHEGAITVFRYRNETQSDFNA